MKSALYHIRTRCNYSQGMVARELGVSRQILSFWESGTKAIPKTRKTELAQLFGVPESILEENEESIVREYCDRPMYCCVCQGRQVFSFRPKSEHLRVSLAAPGDIRPDERCRELLDRKNAALDKIEKAVRFDPQHQADQITDMELSVLLLEEFNKAFSCCVEMEPKYRSRLLQFLLEQQEIISTALIADSRTDCDEWQKQQIHLLRCHWGNMNRTANRKRIIWESPVQSSVWEQIDQWYQQAKTAGWNQAELQWRLNQILEQEHEHELD